MKQTKQNAKFELQLSAYGIGGHIEVTVPKGESEENISLLAKCGIECIKAEVEKGEKYLTLCEHIRKAQIGPKAVSSVLRELGFRKQRITEINKVSQLNNEMWSALKARTIGFREALEISRGVALPMLENPETTIEELKATQQEEQDEAASGKAQLKTEEEKKTAKIFAAAVAAKRLLNVAEALNWRSKTYNTGNGWKVVVSKTKAKNSTADSKETAE